MGKRPHLKISNGSKMVTSILRPCLSKFPDFVNLNIFPRWNVLKYFKIGDNHDEFLNGVFCILLPGGFVEILYNARFSDIHSSKKERQLSNCLEASSFVKFQWWLALRCLMTVREHLGIFEWVFWQIVVRSIVEMTFVPKLTDLHSSPKERQLQKSCVSFGEECTTPAFTANCSDFSLITSLSWLKSDCNFSIIIAHFCNSFLASSIKFSLYIFSEYDALYQSMYWDTFINN